ncbi:YfdX family protein [Salmonella enterica]|nr:YfdX family protein [Salmonella enterica subsp. enterica serovar Muenchen]ECQ3651797.1 YfdX family protein [Salmonella enterica]EDV4825267.1 YfdX family protein [Salmonella enterica]EKS5644383.1 YfdX family protein [Salmonella enterica]EKS5828616.1 YfdX family protein [Salmonella enterica]
MKKRLITSALALSLVSGYALAATDIQSLTPSQVRAIDNIAQIGNAAMQDVQLARVALFDGDISGAKHLLNDANRKINDDQTDWSRYIRKDKKAPIDGDGYVVINATIAVSEDYQTSEAKNKAVRNANEKLKKGDRKGAVEVLKLAGITVSERQVLMPLKTTRNDIQKAINLFNEGKYYQSNLMLLSAEEGIIFDTEVIQN